MHVKKDKIIITYLYIIYIWAGTLTTWNVPSLENLNMYVINIEPKLKRNIIAQAISTPRPLQCWSDQMYTLLNILRCYLFVAYFGIIFEIIKYKSYII